MKKFYLIISLLLGIEIGYADDIDLIKEVISIATTYKGDNLEKFLKKNLKNFEVSIEQTALTSCTPKNIDQIIPDIDQIIPDIDQIILNIGQIIPKIDLKFKLNPKELIFVETLISVKDKIEELVSSGKILPKDKDEDKDKGIHLTAFFDVYNLVKVKIEEEDFKDLLKGNRKYLKTTHIYQEKGDDKLKEKLKQRLKTAVVNVLNEKIHLLLFDILFSRSEKDYPLLIEAFKENRKKFANIYKEKWYKKYTFTAVDSKEYMVISSDDFVKRKDSDETKKDI